tara:strand:+ start:103 stop:1017 length:915 start_codon:yes stop_codon:yes gene_type:complete
MNGVLGMSQLLGGTVLTDVQRRYNDIIYASGSDLLRIINDLLDFPKVEAGKLELEQLPFSIEDLVTDVEVLFSVRSSETGAPLITSVSDDVPSWLEGDAVRVRQVLVHLVNNAFKFTTGGEIVVKVARVADGVIRVDVRDTGIGIAEADQAALFEAFTQVSASTTREYGGTGLGLAICAQLTELMGGRIGVNSAPGVGSTFFVELPMPAYAGPAKGQAHADLDGLNVLVVDDCSTFREVITQVLRRWGVDSTACATATEALASLDAAVFDCVLIDWKLVISTVSSWRGASARDRNIVRAPHDSR